jgi:hypothetical protein
VVDVAEAVDQLDDAGLGRPRHDRPGVVEDAVAHLVGEVEPAAAALEVLDHPQGVLVVVESPTKTLLQRVGQRLLTRVSEGRMAEVVAERDRLCQVLVEPERTRHGARDARHLERVREARAEVVALGRDEDLGLVLEAPKCLRVHDAVAVALVRRPQAADVLGVRAPARVGRAGRPRRQPGVLLVQHPREEAVGHRAGQRSFALRGGKVVHTS